MSFIKGVFATVTGLFLFFFLLLVLIIGLAASQSSSSEPYVKSKSVLKIPLSGTLSERVPVENPFAELTDPGYKNRVTINGLRAVLENAAADERIAGVWLDITTVGGGFSSLQEIHQLITTFKQGGKFVYASTNDAGMNEAGYFLATAADSIFAPEQTYIEFDGFYLQGQFYKRLFDKIGIDVDVVNSGQFKTAAESYTHDRFTPANRLQLTSVLNTAMDMHLSATEAKTGKPRAELNILLNKAPIFSATDAYKAGLVDSLLYPQDLETLIAARAGSSKLETVTYARYSAVSASKAGITRATSDGKIAILYATGLILPVSAPDLMNPDGGVLTATLIKKELDKITKDESIKAIVLRIDSPGGAATTSELIWKMVKDAAGDRPVVASMGRVAASGGYYIAMAADTVVAMPTTITGSIGVIMQKISYKELFEDQLGITFDEVATHPNASWMDPANRLNPSQRAMLTSMSQETYTLFKKRVADNRGMTLNRVDALGQGRVWSGADAKANGLVDVLGGLDTAIAIAAEMAGLTGYDTQIFPKEVPLIERLLTSGMQEIRTALLPEFMQRMSPPMLLDRPMAYTLFPLELEWK
jgi:protease-4